MLITYLDFKHFKKQVFHKKQEVSQIMDLLRALRKNDFPISFSTYQHQKLITEILVKHNIEKKQKNKVMSIISKAKNSGDPEKYFDSMLPIFGMNIPEMFKEYEERLMQMNSVDFDNILVKARDILKNYKDIQKYRR